jgi:hypothetical protein
MLLKLEQKGLISLPIALIESEPPMLT